MKFQPQRNYQSNDDIQTPQWLAEAIVSHFSPWGNVLEPCSGEGAFVRALKKYKKENRADPKWQDAVEFMSVLTCEIKHGFDFFDFQQSNDWIITNPPWSKIRSFLQHAMKVADNIVFLMTVNHAFTKARIRDVKEAGFSIVEIAYCPTPKEFPQSGFQLGAVYFMRGSFSSIRISEISGPST